MYGTLTEPVHEHRAVFDECVVSSRSPASLNQPKVIRSKLLLVPRLRSALGLGPGYGNFMGSSVFLGSLFRSHNLVGHSEKKGTLLPGLGLQAGLRACKAYASCCYHGSVRHFYIPRPWLRKSHRRRH